MHREITLGFVSLQLIVMYMYASADEPVNGCSQLQSLEHLLEKLVRIEFKLEQLEKKHGNAEESNGEDSGSCVQLRRLDDLSQTMEVLEKRLNEQSQADVKVAFTAILLGGSNTINKDENVVFNKVQTNIGEAYNPSNGKFVAPRNGTYYFHTSFLSDQISELWVAIFLNSADTARANARGLIGRHGTGSQSVILELKTGDIVSVKMLRDSAIWGDSYSAFSGFFIH